MKLSGVKFARKNEIFGKYIEHGGWFKPEHLRFFRFDKWDKEWDAFLHTYPAIFGNIKVLDSRVFFSIHYDYQNVQQFVKRSFHGYALVEGELEFIEGMKPSKFKMLYLPLKKIFGKYVIRRGFLDGMHGFVLALLLGVYELMIQIYIWEYYKNKYH